MESYLMLMLLSSNGGAHLRKLYRPPVLRMSVARPLFQLFSLCHRSTLQRRRKTSTRANRSAAIRKPAISFVATPLISGVLNGRGGHPSVTPTSFYRVAGLTVATCHAALHAASHARPGELCAAFDAAPSRPSRRQPVIASELGLRSPHSFVTIQLRGEPPSITRHQR